MKNILSSVYKKKKKNLRIVVLLLAITGNHGWSLSQPAKYQLNFLVGLCSWNNIVLVEATLPELTVQS